MTVYYNEFDPKAAAWLRELIKQGHIADGVVDERSIGDVKTSELAHYTQCHFFAGIGGWSYALRQAGWPDDRPVWTGSCPCQPFSTAGKQKGKTDDRHLWPIWFSLVKQCRPSVIFGEQVSSAIAFGWMDEVAHDLEAEGYAFGAAVLPACSVGAPHKRDRLWFVGDASNQWGNERSSRKHSGEGQVQQPTGRGRGIHSTLGNTEHNGRVAAALARGDGATIQHDTQGQDSTSEPSGTGSASNVADTERKQKHEEQQRPTENERERGSDMPSRRCMDSIKSNVADTCNTGLQRHGGFEQEPVSQGWEGAQRHHWSSGVFINCPDGKQRLIERRIFSLVNGFPCGMARVLPTDTTEEIDAEKTSPRDTENLPLLRGANVSKEVQRSIGRLDSFHQTEELQQNMWEQSARNKDSQPPSKSEETPPNMLPELSINYQPSRSPHRQEPDEQRVVEFTDLMRFVSSQISLEYWSSETERTIPLQDLWEAFAQIGYVPKTLHKTKEVWRSIDNETREQIIRNILLQRSFYWREVPLLTAGVLPFSRQVALKGLGNAIVPQVAAEFISAYINIKALDLIT